MVYVLRIIVLVIMPMMKIIEHRGWGIGYGECYRVLSKAGVTDISSIALMILDRHIYGPNRDDVCHTGNTTEDVINAFPVWLDWRESTLQDIKDTCNLLNIQYERVFNVICERFNILAGDRYTVDKEDGVYALVFF